MVRVVEPFALDPDERECLRRLDAETRGLQAELPTERVVAEVDALAGVDAASLEPGPALRAVAQAREKHGGEAAGAWAKLLILRLIESYPARIRRIVLPASIEAFYPPTLHKIARGLAQVDHESYIAPHAEVALVAPGHADFWRDLRLASQHSLPICASRAMDRVSYLSHTFYRHLGPKENLRALRFLVFRLHGMGPLFRMHIDERDLSDFDPEGWETSMLRVVEMLRLYPEVKGTVGTGWGSDPKLEHISPRRGRANRIQMAHGAFRRYEGTSELIVQRAIKKSATRRRLYESGEYVPTAYTTVWARRDILRWAREIEARR